MNNRIDLLLVAIATAQMPVHTVTDTRGDPYVRVGQLDAPPPDQRNPVHVELWYAVAAPGSGARAVTVSFASAPANAPPDSDVGIYEFGDQQPDEFFQLKKSVTAVGFGNQPGTQPDAGGLPVSNDPILTLIFVVGSDGGPAPGTGSGNTPVTAGNGGYFLEDHQDEPDFVRFYTETMIVAGVGFSPNAAFSITYPSNWAVIGAAFTNQ